MTSDRESVEKDRHDFTASELTDLRGIHESAMEALRAANAAVEESIRIQRRAMAAIDKVLREATGRPRGAPPAETVHLCPPGGSGLMPCCGRTPFEVPQSDRMTLNPENVTCRPRAAPPHPKPLGTCGVMPENPHPFDQDACVGWTRVSAPEDLQEKTENDRMERRGGR